MNKVDNAIILAAGMGTRFVPITYEMPKGLIEVNGQTMIERQIEQLNDRGISDITIVIGYMKEKFEFLKLKYGVKLVYNKQYMTMNNLYSLYLVRNELKNTYILSSDNYIKGNIFSLYEDKSWYAAIFNETKNDEWYLEFDKKNCIINITKGGEGGWHMYGPVYFNNYTSNKIIGLLEKYIKIDNVDQYYWEDILINNIDNIEIYINKRDDILEFESFEELREFDNKYLIDSNNSIIKEISNVFCVEESKIYNIEPMKEGMTNNSFKFNIYGLDSKFICRVPGVESGMFIDRENEYFVYKQIRKMRISDDVIYFNKNNGIKISKYINNPKKPSLENNKDRIEIIKLLKILHNSDIKFKTIFDFKEEIYKYEKICNEKKININKYLKDYKFIVDELINILSKLDIKNSPIHLDPNIDNFISSNEGLKLIDWEYASMGDKLIDLAMLSLYSELSIKEINSLISEYYKDDITKDCRYIRVYSYISLGGILWALWSEIKAESGIDFREYKETMYRYSKEFYKEVMYLCNIEQ